MEVNVKRARRVNLVVRPIGAMPVYAKIRPKADDRYFETSATIGLQAPIISVNRKATIACAMRLGASLLLDSGFGWVHFRRWIPNAEYGMELCDDATFQIYFTRFGLTLTHNWHTILVPADARTSQHVLIYDYDSHCFHFCDRNHFWNKTTVAKVVPKMVAG